MKVGVGRADADAGTVSFNAEVVGEGEATFVLDSREAVEFGAKLAEHAKRSIEDHERAQRERIDEMEQSARRRQVDGQ
jgi:hypothetical protein